jgi:SAM-dependent methyltransferase
MRFGLRLRERLRRRWSQMPTAATTAEARSERFQEQLAAYRAMGGEVRDADLYPCLEDRTATTPFDPHYFYQAVWATERLVALRPAAHVDVGSELRWVALLAAWFPVTFIDIRPAPVRVANFETQAGSILQLPYADRSVASLSCMHVIEHVGLGRYGDSLDPQGSIKAARELQRVVAPGGHLFLSTPVGRKRTCFNAHRIHPPHEVVEWFDALRLVEFGAVSDDGAFRPQAEPAAFEAATYGCGLFRFQRQ